MKRKLLLGCLFVFCQYSYGQDINFSQFYELPLLRNPALAGFYTGDIRATSAFRNQWSSITTPYQTTALGTEMRISLGQDSYDYLSVGFQITNDVAGDSKMGKSQFLPMVTFHKSLSASEDTYLSGGFLGGGVQQRFDATKLSFDDQFVGGSYSSTNPTRQTFASSNVSYWDAAAGLSFSSVAGYDMKYYLGAAYFHFTQPKVAFSRDNDIRLNKKFVLNAGMSISTSDNDRVVFYGDYFFQGGNSQGQAGALFSHDIIQENEGEAFGFAAGGFYRWYDAFVPVIKLDYYKWSVGLTYDVNASKLTKASQARGGFELTLSFKSFLNIKNSSIEKVRCVFDPYK